MFFGLVADEIGSFVCISYWAKPNDCLDLARYLNDHIATVVSDNPKRFVGKSFKSFTAKD